MSGFTQLLTNYILSEVAKCNSSEESCVTMSSTYLRPIYT